MSVVHFVPWFFGGVFLGNAVPHWVAGASGRAFQSPFATPRGIGLSSSTLNVVWGFVNLVIGYLLVWHVGAFDPSSSGDVLTVALGALAISLFCARHFGSLYDGNAPHRS